MRSPAGSHGNGRRRELADDGKTLERARSCGTRRSRSPAPAPRTTSPSAHIDVDQLPNVDATVAALSPELPVRRRRSSPVPAGAVSGRRQRRLRRHPPHRIDGERVRAWRHGRAPHAGALAGPSRHQAVAGEPRAVRRRRRRNGAGGSDPPRARGPPLRPAWALVSRRRARALRADRRRRLRLSSWPTTIRPDGSDAQNAPQRWSAGERKAVVLTPEAPGEDFNDIVRRSDVMSGQWRPARPERARLHGEVFPPRSKANGAGMTSDKAQRLCPGTVADPGPRGLHGLAGEVVATILPHTESRPGGAAAAVPGELRQRDRPQPVTTRSRATSTSATCSSSWSASPRRRARAPPPSAFGAIFKTAIRTGPVSG